MKKYHLLSTAALASVFAAACHVSTTSPSDAKPVPKEDSPAKDETTEHTEGSTSEQAPKADAPPQATISTPQELLDSLVGSYRGTTSDTWVDQWGGVTTIENAAGSFDVGKSGDEYSFKLNCGYTAHATWRNDKLEQSCQPVDANGNPVGDVVWLEAGTATASEIHVTKQFGSGASCTPVEVQIRISWEDNNLDAAMKTGRKRTCSGRFAKPRN